MLIALLVSHIAAAWPSRTAAPIAGAVAGCILIGLAVAAGATGAGLVSGVMPIAGMIAAITFKIVGESGSSGGRGGRHGDRPPAPTRPPARTRARARRVLQSA